MLLGSRALSIDNARSTSSIVLKLLGEFLREMAVLIGVFAPLDKIVQGNPLTGRFLLNTIVIVTVLLAAGIVAEVRPWTKS